MDVVNFPGIIAQNGLLSSSDILPDDLILIGKKVNNSRDGSQYKELAIRAGDLINMSLPSVYTCSDDKSVIAKAIPETISPSVNLIVPAGTYIIDFFATYRNNPSGPPQAAYVDIGLVYNTDISVITYDPLTDVSIYGIGDWGKILRLGINEGSTMTLQSVKVTFSTQVIIKPLWQDTISPGSFEMMQKITRAIRVAP